MVKRKMNDKDYYLSQARRPLPKNKSSQYRGVQLNSKNTTGLPFKAMFVHKGRRYYLGAFATELEAAQAYNKAALAVIGDYAVINVFPETIVPENQ